MILLNGLALHISKYFTIVLLLVFTSVITGCATLPDNSVRTASYFIEDTTNTTLGQIIGKREASNKKQSGAYPLGNGLDAFVARAVLADKAEKTLDVQYYLYHNDTVGTLLTNRLIRAADRGVRVRLLLDDMGLAELDLSLIALDTHSNIEVRIFNPFSRNSSRTAQFITRFGSVTRRMHNKSFTADNQAAIVGGRNIGDEYFDASLEYTFTDLDVLLVGPVVDEVSTSFDLYWNNSISYPITTLIGEEVIEDEIQEAYRNLDQLTNKAVDSNYIKALENSDLTKKLHSKSLKYYWGDIEVIYDLPDKVKHARDKKKYHLSSKLAPHFQGVTDELFLISPYFVPGKAGAAFLIDLEKAGTQVTIITNSLAANDVPAVHAGYMKYRKRLLKAGVEIYEFKTRMDTKKGGKQKYGDLKSGLHAKSFVLDRKAIFIGSLNLDPRSNKENTEIGAMIQNPELANKFQDSILSGIQHMTYKVTLNQGNLQWQGIDNDKEVTFSKEPNTSWWTRFKIGALRIIPAESQL